MSFYKACEIFFSHSNDYVVVVSDLFGVALRFLIPSCLWTKLLVFISILGRQNVEYYSSSVRFLEVVAKAVPGCFTDERK